MPERTSEGSVICAAVSDQLSHPMAPTLSATQVRELISRRAYEIYTQRDTGSADELSDWLKAEEEVVTMLMADPQETVELEAPNGPPAARPRIATRVSKAADAVHRRVSRSAKRRIAVKSNPA